MHGVDRPDWFLVLGGADSVWRDVQAIESMLGMPWPGIVIATNRAGVDWPRELHHWATLHPDLLAGWIQARARNGFPMGFETWSRRAHPILDHHVKDWGGGASGQMAVVVADIQSRAWLDSRKCVLAGVPMTATPHYHNMSNGGAGPWTQAERYWLAWIRNGAKMQGWVRSMGGRTADLLGFVTADWLGPVRSEAA